MKYTLLSLVFLLLFTACKDVRHNKTGTYPEVIVGTFANGSYSVVNKDIVKTEWEKSFKAVKSAVEIHSFTIEKIAGAGNTAKEHYILMAQCKDSTTTLAALLDKKGNDFYLDKNNPVVTKCSGNCTEGCLPAVNFNGENTYLVCTPCTNCTKIDTSINFTNHN